MATIQQVKAGVLKYLASDIIPHMVPWKQVAVEVYLGLAADNIANKILEMRSKPEISMMGIEKSTSTKSIRLLSSRCREAGRSR